MTIRIRQRNAIHKKGRTGRVSFVRVVFPWVAVAGFFTPCANQMSFLLSAFGVSASKSVSAPLPNQPRHTDSSRLHTLPISLPLHLGLGPLHPQRHDTLRTPHAAWSHGCANAKPPCLNSKQSEGALLAKAARPSPSGFLEPSRE